MLNKKFRVDVCEAEDGIQGLDVYKSEEPSLIFLDIIMPNMNGIEFLKELRKIDQETKVAIMTGIGDKELIQKIALFGITDYIIKSE